MSHRSAFWTGLFNAILFAVTIFAVPGLAVAQSPTPTTTIQNGNADTRLQLNYDGGLYVPGTYLEDGTENDSIPAEGAGTRMMWYPAKGAFRAGRVGVTSAGFDWNASNVGQYSVAFGLDTEASGYASTAMGGQSTAGASHAFAVGNATTASGTFGSAALGNFATASGAYGSFAVGDQTTASGESSTALGSGSEASGDWATAMGRNTTASSRYATAMGIGTTASDFRAATAMGIGTTASDSAATAMGTNTTASGARSTAMGLQTTAATSQSLSIGEYNSANTSADSTLFVAGNGGFGNPSDALVLDFSGNLTIAGTLTENSDRRLKTGIEPLGDDLLTKLGRLRPVRFQFKNERTHPSGEQIGLIAQDVRKEFPALVSKGSGGYLSLAYPKMTAVLLKGIQEQQTTVEQQRARIDSLKARVDRLERLQKRVAKLESRSGASLLAGLPGSGLLLGLLLGGLLGAALLWRRRD